MIKKSMKNGSTDTVMLISLFFDHFWCIFGGFLVENRRYWHISGPREGGVPPLGVRNGLWGGYPPGGPVAGSYGARNGVYGGGTPPRGP